MREIKFRAWNTGTKTMLLWERFNLMYPLSMFTHIKDYQFEVMQYAGLKDKNGKEIYEGDIVKPDNIMGVSGTVYLVEWQAPAFAITSGRYVGDVLKSLCEYCEVIGNIYEHNLDGTLKS